MIILDKLTDIWLITYVGKVDMKNKLRLLIIPIIAAGFLVGCSSDQSSKDQTPILENYSIHRDDEFGGAYIDISIADFNSKGFQFGDSLNLTFTTNDKVVLVNDVGYFSGYYVPAGQELVVGYKGYDYIKYCINYGSDVYTENNFNKDTKVTITVNDAQKYKQVEETLSITYSDDRTKYDSDEEFANFREVKVGNIKPGMLYRGASPIDNSRKRAEIVDKLLEKYKIGFDVDLSDKFENIYVQDKYVISDYMKGLIDNNHAVFLGMGAAYTAQEFSNKMKTMFLAMLESDGPYYIHCLEGKDRTGYVCMVIEALCGATYDELINDYFITYKNYYKIEKGSEKYNVLKEMNIDSMIRYVFSFNQNKNLLTAGYYSDARAYLENIGLTSGQIDALQEKFSN